MLVSIIIPIYNVAPYIEQCLQSVMAQSYRNLEVLLIDDCGQDESISIVKTMLGGLEDCVIDQVHYKILHHEHNRGLSAARNTGIDAATGEWIYFLDSDDYLYPNAIELLMPTKEQESTIDMVIGDFDTNISKEPIELKLVSGVYQGDILSRYCESEYYMMAWNKLIRKDFIDNYNLYFEEGLIHEDNLWSFGCACCLRKICVVRESTYFYRTRPGSIMKMEQTIDRYNSLCRITLGQLIFLSKYDKKNNKTAYIKITKEIRNLFFWPLYNNRPDLSKAFFAKLRKAPSWNPIQVLWFFRDCKSILVSLFHLMPYSISYRYYRKLNLLFYDCWASI